MEWQIWQRQAPTEGSIGEILDHADRLTESIQVLFMMFWLFDVCDAWSSHKCSLSMIFTGTYHRLNFSISMGWNYPLRETLVSVATM